MKFIFPSRPCRDIISVTASEDPIEFTVTLTYMAADNSQVTWRVTWFPCHEDIRKGYLLPDYKGPVPFLFSGKTLRQYDAGKTFEMTEDMMMFGILAVYFDVVRSDPSEYPEVDSDILKLIVERFRDGMHFESVHDLVLRFADRAQEEFDYELCARFLRSGIYMVKQSR